MHLFHKLQLDNEILFVDTQYHFTDTLKLRDRFLRDYRLNLVTLYPEWTPERQEAEYGRKLYKDREGQPVCCRTRKEEPFLQHMRARGHRLVCLGLRRSEGGSRQNLSWLTTDPRFDGYVLHPILDWDDAAVSSYLETTQVPVHPLHAQRYPSIGCACCTTPVGPNEHPARRSLAPFAARRSGWPCLLRY